MALKFGTSGVRGLVTEMTDRECYLYARAFAQYLKEATAATAVSLAGDLRHSTPRIIKAVKFAIREMGLRINDCGHVATPAVLYHGMQHRAASIMVTGSHIPDDRNGIKFNLPDGEVLKKHELEISDRYRALQHSAKGGKPDFDSLFDATGAFKLSEENDAGINPEASRAYRNRYTDFFSPDCLQGIRIVFYQHSSVSREILPEIFQSLGAEVISVGFSETFVPIDTEAVQDIETLAVWTKSHQADALVSTDGDGDRPLVVDETGTLLRGDVLGILVAAALQADSVSVPVSCNTALELCGKFSHTERTRIGSPYVIESMHRATAARRRRVVGYEANGGFLTATDLTDWDTGKVLEALPTRDATLPIIAALRLTRQRDKSLSQLVMELPPRFTASGLLREFPSALGLNLVKRFEAERNKLADTMFSDALGKLQGLDLTDGARMTFESGDIVHFRPSGNAPEFRCYTESSSAEEAMRINRVALEKLQAFQ